MYSEGSSESKSRTENWPVPRKSSVVWQWLSKPWPEERVVAVVGGHPGRSVGMTQGLPACFLANAVSTAGHHNKDSGLSQHLASSFGPWRYSQTPVYVSKHTTVHESWPRSPMRVLACHLTKLNNNSEQMPGFQGQTDGWAKWLWTRITLPTHKGSLGFWLSGCYSMFLDKLGQHEDKQWALQKTSNSQRKVDIKEKPVWGPESHV